MDHNFMKKNLLFHASKVKIQTKYNYFQWVAKKYNKLKKINPNFMGYILFYCLSKQKFSNLNLVLFWVQIYATILHLSETSSEILWFVSSVRYHLSEMLWIFFSHYPCMKPWHLNKSHDFQTLFAIFNFSWTSVRSIAVKFRDKHASTIYFFLSLIRHQFSSRYMNITFPFKDFEISNHL